MQMTKQKNLLMLSKKLNNHMQILMILMKKQDSILENFKEKESRIPLTVLKSNLMLQDIMKETIMDLQLLQNWK